VNQIYLDTARLLIQVAPIVMESGVFALKGGTAINLFIRDMPRLSVDLDLVFPDYRLPRDQALALINEAILQSAARLKTRGFQTRTVTATGAGETKLLVRRGDIEIKVEVNFVMRGTVQPVRNASLSPMAREALQADIEIPVTSLEDVYGGKLVAAMDRQHPRDLFDVMQHLPNTSADFPSHPTLAFWGVRRACVDGIQPTNDCRWYQRQLWVGPEGEPGQFSQRPPERGRLGAQIYAQGGLPRAAQMVALD